MSQSPPRCRTKTGHHSYEAWRKCPACGAHAGEQAKIGTPLGEYAPQHSQHRIYLADDPETTPELLRELVMSAYGQSTIRGVLRNPRTNADTLREMVASGKVNGMDHSSVAKHPNCPPDILARLASSGLSYVAAAAIMNRNVDPAVVEAAVDKASASHPAHWQQVGMAAAQSVATPVHVLDRLWSDPDPAMAEAMKQAATTQISHRTGVPRANRDALRVLAAMDGWWRFTPDSDEVALARAMHPDG